MLGLIFGGVKRTSDGKLMRYEALAQKMIREAGVEQSTMMGAPCLRYQGQFMAMFFVQHDALIIKVSAAHY